MRKFLKNTILDIFRTMYQAHAGIQQMIDQNEGEKLKNILCDCQDAAIQIGKQIEESEGEGTNAVRYLEDYCEAAYEVAVNSIEIHENRARKLLDHKLLKAENSVKNDLPVRLEIVFCPYKAAMWDSLESVWKAAVQDPDCDVYVVAIPYYDRNPDNSLGTYHYEGSDLPDYVQVTSYEVYDFETRRPDVIYIHNPYDDYNYVTSVDPRFYSSRLKQYTDLLVYIPYFLVDDSRSLVKLEHYALVPAVINSGLTIVQSEKVRQKYIEALWPHYGSTDATLKWLEDHILGIGSPKIDAAMQTKPSLDSLPEEWQAIIGDGQKKIIFYNTHLSFLMAQFYQMFFLRLKDVFDYFRTRDDVVLLWRPHPLAIATAQSMNPAAVEPYMQIVEQYKKERWGIYDDTPDLDRSITLADAYYGSDSSLVPVFRAAGKPVLIEEDRVLRRKYGDATLGQIR